jgi:hypothetical protein
MLLNPRSLLERAQPPSEPAPLNALCEPQPVELKFLEPAQSLELRAARSADPYGEVLYVPPGVLTADPYGVLTPAALPYGVATAPADP